MASVTYVQKAQQRYETKPVIDPATGQQKRTPVMGRDGQQKQSKRGPVFLSVTEDDHSRPKPNYVCEVCRTEITVGQPYKHVSPKSGPYGGRKRVRCAACPTWQPWDLSNSLSARVAEIEHNFSQALQGVGSEDEARSALDEAAEAIRELAGEKQEGADNIVEGFGHETEQSEELANTASELEGWADSLDQFDIPDEPQPEDEECPECEGNTEVENPNYDPEDEDSPEMIPCEECSGSGHASQVSEEAWDEWRATIESDCGIQECPV